MLDHLFAEYWTICTLLDATRPPGVFGHFVSRAVRFCRVPSGAAADVAGRPKSDVTRRYITGHSILNTCLQLEIVTRSPTSEASPGEESQVDFIYSLSLDNEQFINEVSGLRRPEISLCRSKT
ncbi:hypothetical protein ILYODFUR_039035 [Ilyodon furcidens]|uniref:Uncharacterized protein n=1 Tax=Ilyodon furcidens TaxID=33524 RepID=A0ABV0UP43_9TELE